MKICLVNEMRNLDRRAIEELGITQEILMENAGQAAYFTVLKEFGIQNKNFVIFCGIGNNGGDGLVVARKIYSSGGKVTVFLLGDPSNFEGAARKNFEIVQKLQISILKLNDVTSAVEKIRDSDAVIDAIFGTGLDREVKGKHRDVINMINQSGKTVFSIDIASGINGDTGEIMGAAVKANFTTTFGLPKTGNLFYPGFELGGKLYVSYISFPPDFQKNENLKIATNDPKILPERNRDTHKGNFCKVLFIAGSSGYLSAPYFAAMSFLKAGGGLSFLATPEAVSAFLGNKGSEIILLPQKSTRSGSINSENKQQILKSSENADMVVIGPGLSLNKETQSLVKELIVGIKRPLLIDGDGINAVASDWEHIKEREDPTILTPHLGEMERITRQKISNIQKNKIDILQNTARELNAIIVLKGAHSLIGYPDQSIYMNLSGNPGMATAGSGDVLTGTIAAMFGLGFPLKDAVRMGVFIHGFAGDIAAMNKGKDGLVASDIMEHLPVCMKMYRDQYDSITKDVYQKIFVI